MGGATGPAEIGTHSGASSVFQSTRVNRKSALALLAALLCLLPCPALAQRDELRKSSPKVFAAFRDVIARPSKSLVRIQSNDKDVALGRVVAVDGWVLTKASLLPAGSKIVC